MGTILPVRTSKRPTTKEFGSDSPFRPELMCSLIPIHHSKLLSLGAIPAGLKEDSSLSWLETGVATNSLDILTAVAPIQKQGPCVASP